MKIDTLWCDLVDVIGSLAQFSNARIVDIVLYPGALFTERV